MVEVEDNKVVFKLELVVDQVVEVTEVDVVLFFQLVQVIHLLLVHLKVKMVEMVQEELEIIMKQVVEVVEQRLQELLEALPLTQEVVVVMAVLEQHHQ